MKILVIKLRQIGDVLLTVPSLRTLKRVYPDAKITVMVNSGTDKLLPTDGLIDNILIYDRRWKKLPFLKKISNELNLYRQIRKENFDLAVNLTEGDRGILATLFSGAKIRAGLYRTGLKHLWKRLILTDSVEMVWDGHVVEQNISPLRKLGITPKKEDFIFGLSVDKNAEKNIFILLKKNGWKQGEPFVHIHPTSLWLFKAWRDDAMASIIDYLQIEKKIKVVLTCQDEESQMERITSILSMTKSSPINLSAQTSLTDLVALSNLSLFFFGIDTAPMHIAAAMNKPVIALFGPSNEINFGPVCDNKIIITSPFKCRPCHNKGCDNTGKSRCLDEISVDMVIPHIDSIIKACRIT